MVLQSFTLALLVVPSMLSEAISIFSQPTYQVQTLTGVRYARGLTCEDQFDNSTCKPMDLLMDVFLPIAGSNTSYPLASKRPAYILSHGGGNAGGNRSQYCFEASAMFFASRGFSACSIDYRLKPDKGLLPLPSGNGLEGWNPTWASAYPAVRDLKAAIRFFKASSTYGVDPDMIVVSGGSAGATNSLAAGATFVNDFVSEIPTNTDPTLAETLYPGVDSTVHVVVNHWSSELEVVLAQEHDPKNVSRWGPDNAPVIEFHGNNDTVIPLSHALAAQEEYKKNNVPYKLVVLDGCPHGSWCYNGHGHCTSDCPNQEAGTDGYDPTMDNIALPFVANYLNVSLV